VVGLWFFLAEIGNALLGEARKRPYVGAMMGVLAGVVVLRAVMAFAFFVFGSDSSRYAFGGSVSLNGKPIQSGVVSFEDTGDRRKMGVAYITAGRFDLPRAQGLAAGTYTVRITQHSADYAAWEPAKEEAPKPKGATVSTKKPARDTAGTPLVIPSPIPARYNVASELMVTIGRWSPRSARWDLTNTP
jgi:hypothetical protein